jgi:hypothetical protein
MTNPADRRAAEGGIPPAESADLTGPAVPDRSSSSGKPVSAELIVHEHRIAIPAQDAPRRVASRAAFIAVLAVTGAVAAAIVSKIVEDFGRPFQLPPEATAGIGVSPTSEQAARVTAAKLIRDGKNLYVTFAIMGGGIGLAFGIVMGLLCRSTRGALLGFAGGAVFGAGLGVAGAYAVLHVGYLASSSTALENEHKIIFAHLAGWAITGLGVGLGASLAMLDRRALLRGLLAAFAGGLIGGGLYVPIAAVLMPSVDTDLVIPDSWTAKLVWIAVPAVLMGVSLGRALTAGEGKSVATAPARS